MRRKPYLDQTASALIVSISRCPAFSPARSSSSVLVRKVVGFEIHPARCPVTQCRQTSSRSAAAPNPKTSRSASQPAFTFDLTVLRHSQPRAIPALATVDGPLPWEEAYRAITALHNSKLQHARESDKVHQDELQPVRYVKFRSKTCCCVDRVSAAMKQDV